MNPSFADNFNPLFLILLMALSFGALRISPAEAQADSIQWHSMRRAQQLAQKDEKKVLIFAQASWCIYCKKMREEVFPNQAVIDSMNAYFYAVKLDVESDSLIVLNGKKMTQRQFAINTQIEATPTTFFINQEGKTLGIQPGYIPAPTFSRLLGFVGSGAYKNMEFKRYLKEHSAH